MNTSVLLRPLAVFLSVAQHRSFRRAAADLGLSAPLVSQIITGLEDDLGHQLLYRTTRKVTMTDAGARLAGDLSGAFGDISTVLDRFRQGHQRPSGRLRITAPTLLAQTAFARFLHGYLQECPDLQIDIDLSDDHKDAVLQGFDLALRIVRSGAEDNRIRKRLFQTQAILCAGPNTGQIAWTELANMLYLRPPEVPHEVVFQRGKELHRLTPKSQMVVNNAGLVRELLRFGGCALFPSFSVTEAMARGELQRILPDCDFGVIEVQALYTARRTRLSNAKHFTDALVGYVNSL